MPTEQAARSIAAVGRCATKFVEFLRRHRALGAVLGSFATVVFAVGQEGATQLREVPLASTITGSGTVGHLPAFTGTTVIGNSNVVQASNGNVGIGTISPHAKLDVDGVINADNGFSLAGTAFAMGSAARGNAYFGFSASSTTAGSNNSAIGFGAFLDNVSGIANTASGSFALAGNTSGGYNTAAGFDSLLANTTGSENMASGSMALFNNTTGNFNSASGYGALHANISGSYNNASGSGALENNTAGGFNEAGGIGALEGTTTGSANTGTGALSLIFDTTGSYSITRLWATPPVRTRVQRTSAFRPPSEPAPS